jgi:hypothetical protein
VSHLADPPDGPIVLRATAALDFLRESQLRNRNDGSALLFDWWYTDRLSGDDLRRVITDVWQMTEWPERYLGTRTWVELFPGSRVRQR